MAHRTARRKFRPPLKEGASLPCSQASSTSGLVEVSQERGREGSQSWLSQLTVTGSSPGSSKPESTVYFSMEKPRHDTVGSKDGIFSLDDSLCSINVQNEDLNNCGGSVQDSLDGNNAAKACPGSPLHQQTHTVLSFCSDASTPAATSDLQKQLSAAVGKFQLIKYVQTEPIDDIIVHCSDSDDETMEQGNLKEPESRFQRKNKPTTHRYDYSKILPRFGPQKAKKGGKKSAKTRTKKGVTLDLVVNQRHFSSKTSKSAVSDVDHHNTTAKGDLSVYDYRPTPKQEGEEGGLEGEETAELNNSNWISKRNREEQVSIKCTLSAGYVFIDSPLSPSVTGNGN